MASEKLSASSCSSMTQWLLFGSKNDAFIWGFPKIMVPQIIQNLTILVLKPWFWAFRKPPKWWNVCLFCIFSSIVIVDSSICAQEFHRISPREKNEPRLRSRFQAGPGERSSQEVEQHVCHCLWHWLCMAVQPGQDRSSEGSTVRQSDEKFYSFSHEKTWEAMTLDILDNDCQQVYQ